MCCFCFFRVTCLTFLNDLFVKQVRYLLVNATTRRDPENNIVGVVGVAQDVTEAAKHDRAVAAMARELRQLVDTANAPIFGIGKYP